MTARTAQAQGPTAIADGLLAQVAGFGGCSSIDSVRRYSEPFFPGVRFFAGLCVLEHGDTARPVVAADSNGIVYVLNSPSAFTFLLLRHPARGLDSTNALAYTQSAAIYTGSLSAGVAVVNTQAAIPDSIWRLTGAKPSQVASTGIARWISPAAAQVVLLAYDPESIQFREYLVYLRDGRITEMIRDDYRSPVK